jgi:hypothetical protein
MLEDSLAARVPEMDAMNQGRRHWDIGDIHGARVRLIELLNEAGIIDERSRWMAGSVTGVCVGDYFNRGEDGAGVVALLRQLQAQARASGGKLVSLLGNHDILMCAVLAERRRTAYGDVASRWLLNGGRFLDLEMMERDREAETWLRNLPALALEGETLYLHSDTIAYCQLGNSIEEVNATVRAIIASNDLDRIAALFDLLCRRGELRDAANLDLLLTTFGGKRLVHGHSPTFAREPTILHSGHCINIDGGLWESEEEERLGFVYWST